MPKINISSVNPNFDDLEAFLSAIDNIVGNTKYENDFDEIDMLLNSSGLGAFVKKRCEERNAAVLDSGFFFEDGKIRPELMWCPGANALTQEALTQLATTLKNIGIPADTILKIALYTRNDPNDTADNDLEPSSTRTLCGGSSKLWETLSIPVDRVMIEGLIESAVKDRMMAIAEKRDKIQNDLADLRTTLEKTTGHETLDADPSIAPNFTGQYKQQIENDIRRTVVTELLGELARPRSQERD